MADVISVDVKQTSTGKPFKGCSLADGRKINVFSDHPLYPEVVQGFDIPDALIYQKGQYWNLNDPSRGARKGAVTRQNNARTADIKEAQDRKETSIAFFNATNAAIELLKAQSIVGEKETKDFIRNWRLWFLAEHEAYKNHAERFPQADPLKEVQKAEPEEGHGPIDW
jgi:hypothetical protein